MGEGESINDFDSCQCGGKLYLIDSKSESIKIEPLISDNSEFETPEVDNTLSEFSCNECGNINHIDSAFCSSCGQILIPARELLSTDSNTMKPKIRVFAGFAFIATSLVLLGFLF